MSALSGDPHSSHIRRSRNTHMHSKSRPRCLIPISDPIDERSGVTAGNGKHWQALTTVHCANSDSAPKTRHPIRLFIALSHIPLLKHARMRAPGAEARRDRVMAVTAGLKRESAASPLHMLPRCWAPGCAQLNPEWKMWEHIEECWGQGANLHPSTSLSTYRADLASHTDNRAGRRTAARRGKPSQPSGGN